MPELASSNSAGYKPLGYCPSCGYPCDPGRCAECGRDVKRPLRRDPRVGVGRLLRMGRTIAAVMVVLGAVGSGALAWAYRFAPSDAVSTLADAEGWWFQGVAIDIVAWRWAEHDRRALAHEKRIRDEIANTPAPVWAGRYQTIGPFGGDVIFAAPQSGLAEYWSSGCGFVKRVGPDFTGLLASETGSELCFVETLHEWEPGPAQTKRLEHFRWGPRHCLIDAEPSGDPAGAMVPIYYLRDYFYFRSNELRLPLVGVPELPASRVRDFDLRWRLTTISGVQLTTGEPNADGVREVVVSCRVDVPVPAESKPVALFAEMPSAKVVETSEGGLLLQYRVTLEKGQALIEPQVGWHFAYDWDGDNDITNADDVEEATDPEAPESTTP